MARRQWAEHYGEMLEQGIRWKREFDPEQVFNGAHMPFGDRSAVADARA